MKKINWKKFPEDTRYSVADSGLVRNDLTGKLLKGTKNKKGYIRVTLGRGGKNYGLHYMVLSTFVPKPESDEALIPDHINSVRDDNRLENLRWATYKENASTQHRMDMIGHKTYQFDMSGQLWAIYATVQDAATLNNIKRQQIVKAIHGRDRHNTAGGWVWKDNMGDFKIIKL